MLNVLAVLLHFVHLLDELETLTGAARAHVERQWNESFFDRYCQTRVVTKLDHRLLELLTLVCDASIHA